MLCAATNRCRKYLGVTSLNGLSGGLAMAQNGTMMNGGGWGGGWMGGYGGILVPILLVVVVAGLAVWVIKQKGR
jgi:hypothetical protein